MCLVEKKSGTFFLKRMNVELNTEFMVGSFQLNTVKEKT